MRLPLLAAASTLVLAAGISSASAAACGGVYSYSGAIVQCTVGTAGSYDITAYGAQGGDSRAGQGGLGAKIAGLLDLSAGEVLDILVGGQGVSDSGGRGGGGGGSFAAVHGSSLLLDSPLVVAGGGGGGAADAANSVASLNSNGFQGSGGGGAGGTGGGGGGHSTSAGGGGFTGNGANGTEASIGGKAFVNGAAGGFSPDSPGGFGGGGGSGQYDGGGGGGGYSGGGGGAPGNGGGGGGSFIIDSATHTDFIAATNTGNGEILITLSEQLITNIPTVPEPASLSLIGVSLASLGMAIRGKRKTR